MLWPVDYVLEIVLHILIKSLMNDPKHLETNYITPIHHINMLIKQLEKEGQQITPVETKLIPNLEETVLPVWTRFTCLK